MAIVINLVQPGVIPGSNLDYALRYAALGWHVFPVWGAENGKCRCGKECKSPGKHPIEHLAPRGQDNATTDPETIKRWWTIDPNAGIGIKCRDSGLAVVDIDPRNGGEYTIESLEAQYGPLLSDVVSMTQGGGEHRIFSLPAGSDVSLPGTMGPGIDLKRNGYIVVPPTKGVNGTYEWEASSDPLDGCIPSPLPDWIRDLANRQQPSAQQIMHPQSRLVSDKTMLELQEALSFVSSDEYHQWVNVGQALKGIGAAGFGLWDNWSRTSDKYDPTEIGRKWRSFREGSFNYESIFKLAADAGWVNPLSSAAAQRAEELAMLAAEHAKEKRFEVVAQPTTGLVPFPVARLDEVSAFIATTQGIAPCVATQMGALVIAALAASRLYESEMGDGSHLYLMMAAQTVGEMRPIHNAISQIIREAGLRRILREQRFSGHSQLLKTLIKSPACLYLASDWGSMATFAKRQTSGSLEHTMHLISQVYGQAAVIIDNPEEVGIRPEPGIASDEASVIRSPALSMFALASHAMLSGAFSAAEIGRGAVEQMIFHRTEIDFSHEPEPRATPSWMVNHLRQMRGLGEAGAELSLDAIFNGNGTLEPTKIKVKFKQSPKDYYPAIDALVAHSKPARPIGHAARVSMRRIAVAMAAWADPIHPVVTRDVLEWCARFICDRVQESMQTLDLLGGSDDGKTSLYQSVMELITSAGPNGASMTEIVRTNYKFRSLSPDKREELLATLIEDQMVVEVKGSGRNGKGKRLVSASFVREV